MGVAEDEYGTAEAPMVGDHLAMDLLNTEARSQGRVVDYWNTGEDVRRWLERHGVARAAKRPRVVSADLLAHGRKLRTLVRELIAARKAGQDVGVDGLNKYLHAYLSSPHLQRDSEGNFALARIAHGDAIASLLGPVAEATAQLLIEGDFALVKQCEHPDCVLWFYDRTKSHKRRWCSMAQCGNRHKATQFRKRSSGGSPDSGKAHPPSSKKR
jgi:predicted RNA-binding Zn ribbon-like protein